MTLGFRIKIGVLTFILDWFLFLKLNFGYPSVYLRNSQKPWTNLLRKHCNLFSKETADILFLVVWPRGKKEIFAYEVEVVHFTYHTWHHSKDRFFGWLSSSKCKMQNKNQFEILNNYSPKWKWVVVDIYQATAAR